MNFGVETLLDELNDPENYVILHIGWDDCVFNTAFLKNGYAESLCDTSIFLVFQYLSVN